MDELITQLRDIRRELSELRRMVEAQRPQLLKDTEVAELLGIGKSTVWARMKAGQLPQPVRLGRETRWKLADIREMVTP